MTLKQRVLNYLYPMIAAAGRLGSTRSVTDMREEAPPVSFYELHAVRPDGSILSFDRLRGKKVLLVNVASNCGYTAQYQELEQLQQQYSRQLVIVGFPSNDFKGQEPGSDEEISRFCAVNFGVTFPLMKKQAVLPPLQQDVYKWLTQKERNGWNEQAPSWNFSKYLVDEEGRLRGFFPPHVSPLSQRIQSLVAG